MVREEVLTGSKFRNWTVIRKALKPGWVCRCSCGQVKTVQERHLQESDSLGCHRCARKARVATRKKNRAKKLVQDPLRGYDTLLKNYKRGAAKRGYEWSITDAEAIYLFTGCCNYCGNTPTKRSTSTTRLTNGIDRVDNDVGYVRGNVTSCCGTCNSAKGDLSVFEFLCWVQKLSNWWAIDNVLPRVLARAKLKAVA